MPPNLRVEPHLTEDEVVARFKACAVGDEKLRWQAVMLKLKGWRSPRIAEACARREDWVRRTVRTYNAQGPEGLEDGRVSNGNPRLLSPEQEAALAEALEAPCPLGGLWDGPKIARWVASEWDIHFTQDTGRAYMRRLGFSRQTPRPRHPQADKDAQEAFKKGGFSAVFETSFETTPRPKSRSGRKTKRDSD